MINYGTLEEFKKENDLSQYTDVYIVENRSDKYDRGWHGDFIELLDDDDVELDRIVINYEEMTPEDMNRTYYANCCNDAVEEYEEDDKIFFIKVENAQSYYNRKESEV